VEPSRVERVEPWWRAAGQERERKGAAETQEPEPRSLSEVVEWPID
jgi:hypothetical protein